MVDASPVSRLSAIPSKFPAALAAGKPALLVGGHGSDIWEEISEQQVGWVCSRDAEAVAKSVTRALEDPDGLREMGERARKLFERKYDLPLATAHWRRALEE